MSDARKKKPNTSKDAINKISQTNQFKIMSKKIYWITKNGSKIDIDEMSVEHLRNTLKMIIRQNQSVQKKCPHNTSDAMPFSDEEVEALTNKTQYQIDEEGNLWK